MSVTILSKDEIDLIVSVADFILKYPNRSVAEIKQRFRLTSEEYDMIFELCMPRIRAGSAAAYWRTKHHMLAARVKRVIDQAEPSKLKDNILGALKEPDDTEVME